MLNLLEPLDLRSKPFLGPDYVHLMVQAKQIAYHDRDRHIGDPRFADVPTERLISKSYADERRALMDPGARAAVGQGPVLRQPGRRHGLHRRRRQGGQRGLADPFALRRSSARRWWRAAPAWCCRTARPISRSIPKAPTRLEPGKTPLHTLIASLAFRDDKFWAAVGCMGADGQPQIHLQTYIAMIDHGRDIQEALETPRFLSGRFGLLEARDTLHIEARFPPGTIDELEQRGHLVNRWGDWNEVAGHAHGITVDPASGLRIGGSDPRSDGAAIGY